MKKIFFGETGTGKSYIGIRAAIGSAIQKGSVVLFSHSPLKNQLEYAPVPDETLKRCILVENHPFEFLMHNYRQIADDPSATIIIWDDANVLYEKNTYIERFLRCAKCNIYIEMLVEYQDLRQLALEEERSQNLASNNNIRIIELFRKIFSRGDNISWSNTFLSILHAPAWCWEYYVSRDCVISSDSVLTRNPIVDLCNKIQNLEMPSK